MATGAPAGADCLSVVAAWSPARAAAPWGPRARPSALAAGLEALERLMQCLQSETNPPTSGDCHAQPIVRGAQSEATGFPQVIARDVVGGVS